MKPRDRMFFSIDRKKNEIESDTTTPVDIVLQVLGR